MADGNYEGTPSRSVGGTKSRSEAHLPVYEVIGRGIEEAPAKRLAEALKIPVEKVFLRNGIAAFSDPANYLAIPTVDVDPEVSAALRRATTNRHPDIPIEVKAIDYAAL